MSIIKPEAGGADEHGPVVVVHRGGRRDRRLGRGGGGEGEEHEQWQRREESGPRGPWDPAVERHARRRDARDRGGCTGWVKVC